MSDRWIETEAEEVGLLEDDLYGYEDAALDEEGWYEDGDAYEAAEDEWEWADGRGAFEMAYEDEWPESMDEYEDSVLMAEALREVLHEDYHDLSTEEMEQVLFGMLDSMSPAAEWSFTSALKKVLPIAGGAAGAYFGGPAGLGLGANVGGQLASMLPKKGKKAKGVAGKKAKRSAKSGSSSAKQLISMLDNKALNTALLSLAMGKDGRKSVKLGKGKSSVDVGALMSLAKNLFEQAAADADELARESETRYSYLLDSEGEYVVDPADPEARDQALYEALIEGGEDEYDPWEAEMSAEDWPPLWWKRRQARRWQQGRRWAQQAPWGHAGQRGYWQGDHYA